MASASATSKIALARPRAFARRRASAITPTSRSIPTTRRQRGARASAIRPLPVPTSSTLVSSSRSPARNDQKTGLTPGGGLAGDGSIGGRGDQSRVLGHHARGVARLGPLHGLQTLLDLGRRQLDVEGALLDVDDDGVAAPE